MLVLILPRLCRACLTLGENRLTKHPMSPLAAIIRSLTESDLSAAIAVQAAVYPTPLLEESEALASRLHLPKSYCLAAVCDGRLTAYLLAHGWPRQSPPPLDSELRPERQTEVLYIHDLAVAPLGRGLRLRQRLLQRAFELAVRDKLSDAELIAVEGAAPYWRRLGFIEPEVPGGLRSKVAAYEKSARWMARALPLCGSPWLGAGALPGSPAPD